MEKAGDAHGHFHQHGIFLPGKHRVGGDFIEQGFYRAVLTAQGQAYRFSAEHKGRRRAQAAERKRVFLRQMTSPVKNIEGTDAVESEKCRSRMSRPFYNGNKIKISIGNDDRQGKHDMRRPHVVAAAVMKADFPVIPDALLQVHWVFMMAW